MASEAAEEFQSSLNDLTFNSKPLINMLTMLAEENVQYAPQIVQVIEDHIQKARPTEKLPCVYLVDSIMKNIQSGTYKQQFAHNIVTTFCCVFEKVDEKTRQSMFKLRQTWSEMFPATKLYALDVRVNHIDPAWPITAPPDFSKASIHVNPKFIVQQQTPEPPKKDVMADMEEQEAQMRQQLISKQQELLKLQQQELELELAQTRAKLAVQQKELEYKNQLLEQQQEATQEPASKKEPDRKPTVAGVPLDKLNIRDPRLARRLAGKTPVVELKPEIPDLGIDIPGMTKPSAASAPTPKSPVKKPASAPKDPRAAAMERWKPSTDKKEQSRPSSSKGRDPRLGGRKSPSRSKGQSSKSDDKKLRRDDNDSPGKDRNERSSARSTNRRSDRDRDSSRADRRDSSRSTSKEREDKRIEHVRRNYRSSNRERSPSPDITKVRRRSNSSHRSRSRSPRSKASPRSSDKDKGSKSGSNKSQSSKRKEASSQSSSSSQEEISKTRLQAVDRDERLESAGARRRESKDIDERDLDMDGASPTSRNSAKRGREAVASKDKDERFDMPSPKRTRPGTKEDISDLFGSEDQDYRSPLGVSLSQSFPPGNLPPKSPHSGWARFKADNPSNQAQPSPLRPPHAPLQALPRIPRRKPIMDRQFSQGAENLEIPQALLIDQQEELLRQAERRLKSGELSHNEHQELLKSLAELYKLQKQKADLTKTNMDFRDDGNFPGPGGPGNVMSRKTLLPAPQLPRGPTPHFPPGSTRGPSPFYPHGHRPHLDGPPRRPDIRPPGPMDGPHRRPDIKPPGPMDGPPRRPDIRPPGPMRTGHRHDVPPVPLPPMPPIYSKQPKPTSPLNDPRFSDVLKTRRLAGAELVIDDRSFELTPGLPPRLLVALGGKMKVRANAVTREIFINDVVKYRMGDPLKEVMINGKNHTIYFHGALNDVWIDGVQYNIRFDAPPQLIMIGPEQHEISINSNEMMVFIDCQPVGPWGGPPREIIINGRPHDIRFEAPPREILIDSKLCQLNFQYVIPIIMIDNKPHGIQFDGPPRPLTIDGVDYLIPMDQPVKVHIGKRPHQLAFGGPGYEVIMGGKCYEVQFNGPPRDIWLGGRVRKVQLKGPPPEVKILDQITPGDMMKLMKGSPGHKKPQPGPMPAPPHPQKRALLQQPRMMGPRPMMNRPPGHMHERFPRPDAIRMPVDMRMPRPPLMPLLPDMHAHQRPEMPPRQPVQPSTAAPPIQLPPTQINVNDLFSKLLGAGIITKTEEKPIAAEEKPIEAKQKPVNKVKEEARAESPIIAETDIEEVEDLTDLDMGKMKQRFEGVLQRLYTGIQCTSCGTRFTQDETDAYREHLDWHFRQNKRDKEDMNVAKCRKWFYSIQDWIMYVEIEDAEEAPVAGYFGESMEDEQVQTYNAFAGIEGVELEPVATGEDADDMCAVCGDPFDQVWHEEKEEWHLKEALRTKGKTYHHVCYDDALQASMSETPTPNSQGLHAFFAQKEEMDKKPIPALGDIKPDANTIVKTEAVSNDANPVVKTEVASNDAKQDILLPTVKQEPGVDIPAIEDDSVTPVKSPGTPVKDEPMTSPGTPVRDEVMSPGTPLRDEVDSDVTTPAVEMMDTACIKTEPESVLESLDGGDSGEIVKSVVCKTEPETEVSDVKTNPDTQQLTGS